VKHSNVNQGAGTLHLHCLETTGAVQPEDFVVQAIYLLEAKFDEFLAEFKTKNKK